MNQTSFDRNRDPIVIGDNVKVIEIPECLPEGLPGEDQTAIYAQVGKILIVQEFDKDDRAELEFFDDVGGIHTIFGLSQNA